MTHITIEHVGEIEVRRSNRAKRLIISIQPSGKPRITAPRHVPMLLIQRFAQQHTTWIIDNIQPQVVFSEGDQIGHYHTLSFISGSKLASRVKDEEVYVTVPPGVTFEDSEVQAKVKAAAKTALKRQAVQILPARLTEYATRYGYHYNQLNCKPLKTRWGSCSSSGVITLNIWLMQLPDDLIEYVLLHELVHLHHPHHQTAFWQELASILPDYKVRRAELKKYRPALLHTSQLP